MENVYSAEKRYTAGTCQDFFTQNPKKADLQACRIVKTFSFCPAFTLEMTYEVSDLKIKRICYKKHCSESIVNTNS